jgi:predicted lipid-binding transport protein (Tim44 family)
LSPESDAPRFRKFYPALQDAVYSTDTDMLRRLPAITNPMALRELLPERWAKSHPECVLQFRREESAQAAKRRLNRRERRNQPAK